MVADGAWLSPCTSLVGGSGVSMGSAVGWEEMPSQSRGRALLSSSAPAPANKAATSVRRRNTRSLARCARPLGAKVGMFTAGSVVRVGAPSRCLLGEGCAVTLGDVARAGVVSSGKPHISQCVASSALNAPHEGQRLRCLTLVFMSADALLRSAKLALLAQLWGAGRARICLRCVQARAQHCSRQCLVAQAASCSIADALGRMRSVLLLDVKA